MFRRMMALSLLGVLAVGGAAVAWGGAGGLPLAASLAAVLGAGEDGEDEGDHDRRGRGEDRHGERDDD